MSDSAEEFKRRRCCLFLGGKMERAIIFGVGENFKKRKKILANHFDIVALVDNNYSKIYDFKANSVKTIHEVQYDKIIITPTKWEDMYEQLLIEGIDDEKIIVLKDDEKTRYAKTYLDSVYYGQHSDDLIIKSIFSMIGIERPSYIDLGTNHPIYGSNTISLYMNGCRGINIEANPFIMEEIRAIKPEDININIGVAKTESKMSFYIRDRKSGLNTFSVQEMKKWGRDPEEIIELEVTTLEKIIEQYCSNKFPDFLDCDIEGLDFEVLSEYDLKRDGPKVICVEVRSKEIIEFDKMLNGKNYYRFCRIGENNIYVRKEYSIQLSHMDLS